jgi:putative oxidoreductase
MLTRRDVSILFPQLQHFSDIALLLLRLMVAAEFLPSGWSHLTRPDERSKQIGQSKGFTIFLGAAEVLASLGLIFGILTQLAAIGLILVMLGAMLKKILVWHTGFWGRNNQGWHYDLMLTVMNVVILCTGGGGLEMA